MQNAMGSGVPNFLHRAWRFVRWPLLVLAVAYVGLVISRIPAVTGQQKSAETVAFIQAQHLTLADADGSNLPPTPDPKQVDATVEGVDANDNGIRDDVELAIFKRYPNSPYTRAAELQYAMALQIELTRVMSSETLVAAMQQEDRAYFCMGNFMTGQRDLLGEESKLIENMILNTEARKAKYKEIYEKYMTSFGDSKESYCDVDASLLSH